jgi:peptidoglycan/LPS O-acetylase OafA/YrhL
MQFILNSIPYISLFFLASIKYYNFSEIKDEFSKSPNIPIHLLLIMITILLLASIIEYNLGHYFILLLLLVQSIIIDGYTKDIKNTPNLYDKLYVAVMFLFGAFMIINSYESKNNILKYGFIILGLCVLLAIYYLVLVTSNPSTKYKLQNMINNCVIGSLIPILVLEWCDRERKPLVKYVKLFYRKQ